MCIKTGSAMPDLLVRFSMALHLLPEYLHVGVQQTAHRFRVPRFAVQGHIDFVQRSCYLEIERSSNGLTRRVMPGYWGISGSVVCKVAEPKPGSCPKCSHRIALALCLRDQRPQLGILVIINSFSPAALCLVTAPRKPEARPKQMLRRRMRVGSRFTPLCPPQSRSPPRRAF